VFDHLTVEIHLWEIIREKTSEIKTWRLVYANPPALKTWGINALDDIKGNTTDEIFGAGSTEHYLPIITKIINEGKPHTFRDYFPQLKKHFRFTSVPIGEFFITTGSDITDFVEEQQTMQNINQELELRVQERTKELEGMVATLHNALEESKILRKKLHQQAIRDPLTNLYNRRYMEEFLEREIERARRYQHKVCIVFLDIDNFKSINDSFGHEVGDDAIRKISQLAQEIIRGSDVVCRYGGDELVLILPETTLENALDKCEKLRECVSKTDWSELSKGLSKLTISLGVAEFPSHGDTRDIILNSADSALLNAKKNGRNRVVSA